MRFGMSSACTTRSGREQLAELVLIVEDVPASTRFYEDVVGLTLENEPSDDWAWFWAGQVGTLNPRPAGADLAGPVQPSFTMIRTRSRVGGASEPWCLRQRLAATR